MEVASVTRGLYFMADDSAIDLGIALINSIRAWDRETPIAMIPYRTPYKLAAKTLTRLPGVILYDDPRRLHRLDRNVRLLFGQGFFPRPENLRKQMCWFGPFDEFLYLDADIVVFEPIIAMTNDLAGADFLSYSDQHLSGIEHVFRPGIRDAGVFAESDLCDVFNAGFWGGRSGVIDEARLYAYWEECARDKAHLDRSHGGSDQPVFNYMVLRHIPRRVNVFKQLADAPRMWAGTPGFVWRDRCLFDPEVDQPVKFLHWAGIRLAPGAPYWDVWEYFRHLDSGAGTGVAKSRQRAASTRFRRARRFWQRQSDRLLHWLDR